MGDAGEGGVTVRAEAPGTVGERDTRSRTALRGRWCAAARTLWLALALPAVVLFLAGLPAYYERFRSLDIIRDPAYRQVAQENLAALGLSAGSYAAYYVVLGVVFAGMCFAVAAVIFLRRSDEPMALFVALLLVLLGVTFNGAVEALGDLHPAWRWVGSVLAALSLGSVLLFLYLFPDGRFAPVWMRWPGVAVVACVVLAASFPASPFGSEAGPALPYVLLLAAGVLTGGLAQVYRYRRVSDRVERQQTKWVVFGFAFALGGYLGVVLLLLFSAAFEPGSLPDFASAAAVTGFMLLILLSFGFSILKYRLYDIDVIVNRTLVYGALTAALTLVYSSGVTGLQFVFRAVSGQETQLAVVASTLAIAALFGPLRRRIQTFIDRRFYRRKYDARKTLTDFSAKLRNETNLDSLNDDLTGIVRETMQPRHVTLWLKELGRSG